LPLNISLPWYWYQMPLPFYFHFLSLLILTLRRRRFQIIELADATAFHFLHHFLQSFQPLHYRV
jgi:hypothetical protein